MEILQTLEEASEWFANLDLDDIVADQEEALRPLTEFLERAQKEESDA